MKKITALLLLLLTLVSCSEKTPQDLFDESKSGVVLILNEYYYVMRLPNGNNIYFTGISEDGSLENLAFEYADIKNKRQAMTGTGFFIDEQGTIMTNRHVAQPSIDKAAVKESYNNMVASIKAYYAEQMGALSQEYQNLESQKSNCYSYDYYGNIYENTEKLQEIASQQSELEEQFNTLNSVRESLNDHVSLDELKITVVCEIGVAYNNTFVNSDKDFLDKNSCVVVKVSDKEDTDLATIQLKNKKTPDEAYVFRTDGTVEESFIDKAKTLFASHDEKILQIDQ